MEHTTKTIYRRPDHLSVNVDGDDGSIEIVYDGKTLVLYAVQAKQYAPPYPEGCAYQPCFGRDRAACLWARRR